MQDERKSLGLTARKQYSRLASSDDMYMYTCTTSVLHSSDQLEWHDCVIQVNQQLFPQRLCSHTSKQLISNISIATYTSQLYYITTFIKLHHQLKSYLLPLNWNSCMLYLLQYTHYLTQKYCTSQHLINNFQIPCGLVLQTPELVVIMLT